MSLESLLFHLSSGSRDWAPYYGRGTGVFVLAQNVRRGRLELEQTQLVDPPRGTLETYRTAVQRDDLLVTIVGANTGDACRVADDLNDHYVCQSVAVLRPLDSMISKYLEIYLCAEAGGMSHFRRFIYGAARPHLSFQQLKATPIALPPRAEMECIVTSAARALDEISDIEKQISGLTQQSMIFRQSILTAAFRGNLVPQDPKDEPAEMLLERIRSRRTAEPPPPKRAPRNPRKAAA